MATAETEAGLECGWAAEGEEEELKIFLGHMIVLAIAIHVFTPAVETTSTVAN